MLQEEAFRDILQFSVLIKINCSPDLNLFLCSVYAPLCTILDYPIPPCRSLCVSARECENVMKNFDYMWPEDLECDKFPEDGPDELCISNNASSKNDQGSFSTPITSIHKYDRKQNMDYKNSTSYGHRSIGFICPAQLRAPPSKKSVFIINNIIKRIDDTNLFFISSKQSWAMN
jgi:frizzled 1/7